MSIHVEHHSVLVRSAGIQSHTLPRWRQCRSRPYYSHRCRRLLDDQEAEGPHRHPRRLEAQQLSTGSVNHHLLKIQIYRPSSLRPRSSSVLCEHVQMRHVSQRLVDKSECYSGLTDNRNFTFFIHLFFDFNLAAGRFSTAPELVSGLIWKIEACAAARRAASRPASRALGTRKGGPSRGET